MQGKNEQDMNRIRLYYRVHFYTAQLVKIKTKFIETQII